MARTVKYILILMVCLMAAGCGKDKRQAKREAQPPAGAHRSGYIFYKIRPGDTLAKIAKMYTGKESDWRELAKCNPTIDPQHLVRGDLVKIPSRFATLHAGPHHRSTSSTTRSKAAPPATPEEIFGPK